MVSYPVVRLLNLLIFLAALVCCFPVVLVLLLLLWFTGRLGLARNFVFGRTVFTGFPPHGDSAPSGRKTDEEDAIDVEVIRAETVSENGKSESGPQNRLP